MVAPSEAEHDAVDRPDAGDRLRPSDLKVGVSGPSSESDAAPDRGTPHIGEALAPFVAWLATQGLDEADRRRHRDAVERYLAWYVVDTGPVHDRLSRYSREVGQHDPQHLDDARAGLSWWTDHRRLLAQTLPVDG